MIGWCKVAQTFSIIPKAIASTPLPPSSHNFLQTTRMQMQKMQKKRNFNFWNIFWSFLLVQYLIYLFNSSLSICDIFFPFIRLNFDSSSLMVRQVSCKVCLEHNISVSNTLLPMSFTHSCENNKPFTASSLSSAPTSTSQLSFEKSVKSETFISTCLICYFNCIKVINIVYSKMQ